jgi:hypothetical protein
MPGSHRAEDACPRGNAPAAPKEPKNKERDMTPEETRDVKIPAALYTRVEELIKNKDEFDDVPSYVAFVLEEVLKEESPDDAYSAEDEEVIKKRLEDLGYL